MPFGINYNSKKANYAGLRIIQEVHSDMQLCSTNYYNRLSGHSHRVKKLFQLNLSYNCGRS